MLVPIEMNVRLYSLYVQFAHATTTSIANKALVSMQTIHIHILLYTYIICLCLVTRVSVKLSLPWPFPASSRIPSPTQGGLHVTVGVIVELPACTAPSPRLSYGHCVAGEILWQHLWVNGSRGCYCDNWKCHISYYEGLAGATTATYQSCRPRRWH